MEEKSYDTNGVPVDGIISPYLLACLPACLVLASSTVQARERVSLSEGGKAPVTTKSRFQLSR